MVFVTCNFPVLFAKFVHFFVGGNSGGSRVIYGSKIICLLSFLASISYMVFAKSEPKVVVGNRVFKVCACCNREPDTRAGFPQRVETRAGAANIMGSKTLISHKQSIDNSFLSFHKQFQPNWHKNDGVVAKKRMPIYGIIGIFREHLAQFIQ